MNHDPLLYLRCQLGIVKELLQGLPNPLHLSRPIVVKPTPHYYVCSIISIMQSPKGDVYLSEDGEKYYEIVPGEQNSSFVILSLQQRLRLIKAKLETP